MDRNWWSAAQGWTDTDQRDKRAVGKGICKSPFNLFHIVEISAWKNTNKVPHMTISNPHISTHMSVNVSPCF